jgi:hypothetical protein
LLCTLSITIKLDDVIAANLIYLMAQSLCWDLTEYHEMLLVLASTFLKLHLTCLCHLPFPTSLQPKTLRRASSVEMVEREPRQGVRAV